MWIMLFDLFNAIDYIWTCRQIWFRKYQFCYTRAWRLVRNHVRRKSWDWLNYCIRTWRLFFIVLKCCSGQLSSHKKISFKCESTLDGFIIMPNLHIGMGLRKFDTTYEMPSRAVSRKMKHLPRLLGRMICGKKWEKFCNDLVSTVATPHPDKLEKW